MSRQMNNKVPEVTAFFWIIKVLATTVGETFADYLNETIGLGLGKTSLIMLAMLVVVLALQFTRRAYVPWIYWLVVVLVSVVGTLITDNLTDNLGVPLWESTLAFAVLLAMSFGTWYSSEQTLSIHSIYTTRREAFYWATILITFALGTAAGDMISEKLAVGYFWSAVLFLAVIVLITAAFYALHANAVLCFWLAYIMTRPLGASIGDLLSQPRNAGGLGMGTIVTSIVFLVVIVALIIFLSVTKVDVVEVDDAGQPKVGLQLPAVAGPRAALAV